MTATKFDEIVKNRADERAAVRIHRFKSTVMAACKELVGANRGLVGTTPYEKEWYPDFKKILSILASDNTKKGWPSTIWKEETEAVTKELLSIMDEMQKALMAGKPTADGEQPENGE